MNSTRRLVGWMSAWWFLCLWGVSAGDFNVSTSSPQTNPSASAGLRGYRRFFANDSLIGRPVPCTRDDKICFRHNLVFSTRHDYCLPLGGVDRACVLRINMTELNEGSGRAVGSCPKYRDPCPGYRMAYDGICYDKETVHGVICGRDANITRHPFGNFECRVAPATPITVQQPEEDGSCVIPDLRFPDTERRVFYKNPFTEIQGYNNGDTTRGVTPKLLECASDQSACFSKNMVFVLGFEGCHTLLERGPCAEDHVVALDLQAAIQGRAEGTCVHERGGCPKGYKRMLFDNECHEDREIEIEAPGDIKRNQFGSCIVVSRLITTELYPILTNNSCVIKLIFISLDIHFIAGGFSSPVLAPPCGADDMGGCKLYEVVHEPPLPEV